MGRVVVVVVVVDCCFGRVVDGNNGCGNGDGTPYNVSCGERPAV